MKNSITKSLTLVISLALLVCGIFAVSASADDKASANIELVTLNYGGEVRIAYTLSLSGITAENVVLKIYDNAALTGDPYVSEFSGEYYEEEYPIYYSKGISAKDLADYMWAVPCDKSSGAVLGRACRYSVAHYCNATLIDANAAEDLKALAEDLLTYGASAQQRLINIGNIASEPLVTEYNYVYTTTNGVTLDGYSAGLYAPGAKVVPSYSGNKTVSAWIVTNADGTSYSVSTSDAANGFTVTQNAIIAPEFAISKVVADFSEGFVQDAPVTSTKDDEDSYANIADDATSHTGTEVIYEIADPLGGTNNALKVTTTQTKQKQPGRTDVAVSGEGNCYVFETDIYIASSSTGEFTRVNFRDTAGNAVARFMLCGNGQIKDYNSSTSALLCTIDKNEWVTLRIEYYKSSVAEESYYKIFADGVLLAQSYGAYKVSDAPISAVRLQHQRLVASVTYYDNISAYADVKSYTPEAEIIDFEDNSLTGALYESKDSNNLIESGTDVYEGLAANYSITADPTDAANKVLKVNTFNTSESNVFNGLTSYSVQKTDTLHAGNCTVFESKVYIETPATEDERAAAYLYFRNSSGSVFYLALTTSSDGKVTLKNYQKAEDGTNVPTTLATFATDKWVNLRIETYKSTTLEENYIKVYLGEDSENMTLAAAIAGYNTASLATDANAVTSVRVDYYRKSAVNMYFDDVCVYDQNKAYVNEGASLSE